VLLAAAGLCLGAACRKPATNSADYFEASNIHDRLVVDQGEDAYLAPEMGEAETLLAKVPPDSLDAQAARELLAKIRSERTRLEREREEAEKAPADGPTLDDWGKDEAPAEVAQKEEVDAGPTQPMPGMTLREFKDRFGSCFDPGQDIVLAGAGIRQTYELRDREECRTRHVGFEGLVVIFESEKIGGFAQKSALKLTLPDGGEPPAGQRAAQQAPQAPAPPEQGAVPPANAPDQGAPRDYGGIKY
jgi:hypothetical protein